MKKIVIFVLLKIGEISSVIFIPYLLGLWNPFGLRGNYFWLMGLETLVGGVIVPFFIIAVLVVFCCFNWDLAKKIEGKLKP